MKKTISAIFGALLAAAAGAGEPKPCYSGVYPHLAMANREGECGTGAVVPWAGRLWAITYGPHCPTGSSDKLYEITPQLEKIVRPESVGGTPANRLIHRESGNLLIGTYLIGSNGTVRTVPLERMPGRLTGAARHLGDPASKVYVTDMEEALYELDVTTAETRTLIRDGHNKAAFEKLFKARGTEPPPGWNEAKESNLFGYHGKGTCSGFGKVFYANNGQYSEAARRDPFTPAGCLAQWRPGDAEWSLIRTNQFTEITTPDGVYGNEHPDSNPIWALGWDARSVILTVTDDGEAWHDFLLPKFSHSYDGAHGWNTEWPRIREIGEGEDLLMTMHGMFWRFPAAFRPGATAGIRPRSSYLKVIGDFCRWGDKVVFGCDDHAKSEFLNVRAMKGKRAKARPSESNLWFVDPAALDGFGPREGRGAVWMHDRVAPGAKSDPYLFAGYDLKWLWTTIPVKAELDAKGDGNWKEWKRFEAGGHDLSAAPAAEWIRLVAEDGGEKVSALFHYAEKPRAAQGAPAFASEAPAEAAEAYCDDVNPPEGIVGADAASVVVKDGGRTWRLPRFSADTPATTGRICREVATERDLMHAGGIFYELPAENAGGLRNLHPVAASAMEIDDYETWKGCLTIKKGGKLFIGVADDLWHLGRPAGVGGPWKDTLVKSGVPSDPYIVNGFTGRKTFSLCADAATTVALEADITGCGDWMKAGEWHLTPGTTVTGELPAAFNAYWLRAVSSADCKASLQLRYE